MIKLKEYQEVFVAKDILERVSFFIFWKNKDSIYLGCNMRFANLAGTKSSDEIIGKTDYDLGWGEGEAEFYIQGDREAMSESPKLNATITLTKPDNSKIIMLVNKVPLRDKYGKCTGVFGTATDISELVPALGYIDNKIANLDLDRSKLLFSKREKDCIAHLLLGETIRSTAEKLFISPRTVEAYVENIKNKLGCNKKSELIATLIKKGFMPNQI